MEEPHAEIRVRVPIDVDPTDLPSGLLDRLVMLSRAAWEKVTGDPMSVWPDIGKRSKINGIPTVTRIDIYDHEGRRVVSSRYFEKT